jgi:hypothetical protein
MMVKFLTAGWLLLSALSSAATALTTCVVPKSKCTKPDASDAKVIADIFAKCSQDSVIEFSEGVDYNVFSPVKATNLSNVIISLKGNWNLPQNISAMQALVAKAGGSLTWFTIGGKNVQILGTPNVRTIVDSYSRIVELTPVDHHGMDQVLRTSMVGSKRTRCNWNTQ